MSTKPVPLSRFRFDIQDQPDPDVLETFHSLSQGDYVVVNNDTRTHQASSIVHSDLKDGDRREDRRVVRLEHTNGEEDFPCVPQSYLPGSNPVWSNYTGEFPTSHTLRGARTGNVVEVGPPGY